MISRSQLGRCAAMVALLAAWNGSLRAQPDPQDQLKRATLLAFLENAHWQDPTGANGPLVVGVVGRKAFLRELHAALDGRPVDGRVVEIVEVKPPVDPHCCQALYFAADRPEEIAPVLQSLGAAHVLTVGETDRFLEWGGAVNLFLQDGHMAFEVSLAALGRSGVEISSRLLRFGQIHELPKGRRK